MNQQSLTCDTSDSHAQVPMPVRLELRRFDSEEAASGGNAQESVRLDRLAQRMARHERFPEATSDAMREFMAEQLFPGEEGFSHERIAGRAALYYWWYVEPEEQAANAEKIAQFDRLGYAPRHIAVLLHMSEANVKKVLHNGK